MLIGALIPYYVEYKKFLFFSLFWKKKPAALEIPSIRLIDHINDLFAYWEIATWIYNIRKIKKWNGKNNKQKTCAQKHQNEISGFGITCPHWVILFKFLKKSWTSYQRIFYSQKTEI